ncbi:MAG: acpS [Rickettsiaceae bacterium]|jgi:holo-[acyl-carrier protein] synthase|nr:acpS [Rickettsiaceae bacterium]
MIIGLGTDIVDISRIGESLKKFGDKFEKRVFSTAEIEAAAGKNNPNMKIRYYAKRFAAKEAFSKATGLGIGRGINFTDIEIVNDNYGKPKIRLTSKAKEFLQKHLHQNHFKIDLSMSDAKDIAQAIVIISEID